MQSTTEAVADAAMDAKLREIWGKFDKRWVREILRKSLPPTPVTCLGCEFIVHPRDNFTEFKMWEKGLPPEHEATQALAERMAGTHPVIVDVGANAGAFFLPILKSAGAEARAVVFEPNPVMQARLTQNISLNDLSDQVQVFDCAVSDSPGTSVMHFPRNGNLGEGRVEVGYAHGSEHGLEVALRPLADCLAEADVERVDFLKVDVEGLEDRVIVPLLEGDERLHPDLIYFEVAHDGVWSLPLLDTLRNAGYDEVKKFHKNSLFERKVDV